MSVARRYTLAVILAVALVCAFMPAVTMAETDVAIGFGGYSMVDLEPMTTTTLAFNMPKAIIGASFSMRLGESVTNLLFAGKVLVKVRQYGSTTVGLGGSLAFLTDAYRTPDTAVGVGFGGGVEHRLGERFALTADVYPLGLQFFSSTTRVGILSSGALGVNFYF